VAKVRGAVIWPGWEEPQSSMGPSHFVVNRFSAPTRRRAAAGPATPVPPPRSLYLRPGRGRPRLPGPAPTTAASDPARARATRRCVWPEEPGLR